ncbi:glycosyltransferase family 4 protein [Sabulibacter ruber]|uniref:glycosyltransferase family 4 protein n=1 Tax=Sabulibacter ruber TaxID=2811901 RepID=UPI001A95D475|nr:glycosyltransferase family 4 protein [Sabulibacter ruber]
MGKISVFHISYWYPSQENQIEGVFVKEHIDALNTFCINKLVHFQFRSSKNDLFKLKVTNISSFETSYFIYSKLDIWFIKELISALFFIYFIFKFKINKKYDIINVHVSYPLLTYLNIFKRFIRIPLIVTEHWTAYHFNFGLKSNSPKLNKIKRIFYNPLKLITVSKSLADDIILFSKNKNIDYSVVPNVVKIYESKNILTNLSSNVSAQVVFFSLAYWREVKNPFLLFDAFRKIVDENANALLKIGGNGPLLPKMREYAEEIGLQNNIQFLGVLTKQQINQEMNGITAFLHSSKFETFSVVCAEALCFGVPVISNNIPAIAEYLHEDVGILVLNDDVTSWAKAMRNIIIDQSRFNRDKIAKYARSKFSQQTVGKQYFDVIENTIKKFHERFG